MSSFDSPGLDPPPVEQSEPALAGHLPWQAAFEPFDPPADYAFEPEFEPPIPRPIPARVRQGRLERQRAWAAYFLLAVGLISLLFGETALARRWALFVLPLAYLSGFGLVLIGLSALGIVLGWFRLGPYRYIRRGVPLVARVVGLVKSPTFMMNGQLVYYAITALVKYRDPATGELRTQQLKSPEFQAENRDGYTTSFKVGDYVTAVYLPGRYPKTLQLFGFLDLVPDAGLVHRQPLVPHAKLWNIGLSLAVVVALCSALLSILLAFTLYQPIAFDVRDALWPMIAGGVAAAGSCVVGRRWNLRREGLRIAARNAQALGGGEAVELQPSLPKRRIQRYALLAAGLTGGIVLGGLTALCWCLIANAWLDDSKAVPKAVTIQAVKVETHRHVFREYIVEYLLPGVPGPLKLSTSPEHAAVLARNDRAVAELHAGRFGWPWVKTLRPR